MMSGDVVAGNAPTSTLPVVVPETNDGSLSSSWSPPRLRRQFREKKQRGNKLSIVKKKQQEVGMNEEEEEDAALRNKTVGLVNRKVLGLELVASPALLAKHSQWDFADWESHDALVTGRSTDVVVGNDIHMNSGGASNVLPNTNNLNNTNVVIPPPDEQENEVEKEKGEREEDGNAACGENGDAMPSLERTSFKNTNNKKGGNNHLRMKSSALRRLRESARFSLTKKNKEGIRNLESSDSLDEFFQGNAANGVNAHDADNIANNSSCAFPASNVIEDKTFLESFADMATSFFNPNTATATTAAALPASYEGDNFSDIANTTTTTAEPVTPMSILVKERSTRLVEGDGFETSQINKITKSNSTKWVPLPLPAPMSFSKALVSESLTLESTKEELSSKHLDAASTTTTPTPRTRTRTPPTSTDSSVEEGGGEMKKEQYHLSEESPTGVQELSFYQFFQNRLFSRESNRATADTTAKEAKDHKDDEEEVTYTEESLPLVDPTDDDGSEFHEETPKLHTRSKPQFSPEVSNVHVPEEVAAVKKCITQESLADDHTSSVMVSNSYVHQEEDIILAEKTSTSNNDDAVQTESSMIEDNIFVGAKQGSASKVGGVSGVMKKIILHRTRSIHNKNSIDTDPITTPPTMNESVETTLNQEDQNDEGTDGSGGNDDDNITSLNRTLPTVVTPPSNHALSVDASYVAEEITLTQFLELQHQGGNDTNSDTNNDEIVDITQESDSMNASDVDGKEDTDDDYTTDSEDEYENEGINAFLEMHDFERAPSFSNQERGRTKSFQKRYLELDIFDVDDALGNNDDANSNREVKVRGAVNTLANIKKYSSEKRSTATACCGDINDNQSTMEPKQSPDGLKTSNVGDQENNTKSWFDNAIDNAVDDVVAAVDEDFVEDMLGIAGQAAVVVLKSVRQAIHSIDDVISGCLEDEDDVESNKDDNDDEDDDDREEEPKTRRKKNKKEGRHGEEDKDANSTGLQVLPAVDDNDGATDQSMKMTRDCKKYGSPRLKKPNLKSFMKFRRVKVNEI